MDKVIVKKYKPSCLSYSNIYFILKCNIFQERKKTGGLKTIFIPLEKVLSIRSESQLQERITDRIVKCPNLQCCDSP